MAEQELHKDLIQFSKLKIPVPVKRAAYSDRTAWLMGILSELAYTPFDEDNKSSLLTLATELAELTDRDVIAEKLKKFKDIAATDNKSNNEILRSMLKIVGFELRGVLFDLGTDTQGFVAVRRSDDETSMAVVSFRGTQLQQVRDWVTNLRVDKVAVKSDVPGSSKTLGHVHKGFNEAFKSIESKLTEYLAGYEDIPLYITGHSLGGALATLATWYISGEKLAACYTFGAPRVGDDKLLNYFRTPIYRIVNGADPVPFVPPSKMFIDFLRVIIRRLIPRMNRLTALPIWFQGYQHYGSQRYLSICNEGADGTFPGLSNEFGVGSLERLWYFFQRLTQGEISKHKRIDKYHNIAAYRAKLHAYAIRRQQQE